MTALPIETAPRDGKTLCLLVDYTGYVGEHPLEDAEQAWTVGFNNFDNDGEDVWKFAGWCWSHDHFTEGKGKVIGWAPWMAEAWRPIDEHDGTDALCDLIVDGERWPGYRRVKGRWERKHGYPEVTNVLLAKPSHFMVVPALPGGGPVADRGWA